MPAGSASVACSLLLALLPPAGPQEGEGLIASPDRGWPQWRGPRRDGVSDESGLLQSWPEAGPKLLWTAPNLGRGWSSPIIAGSPPLIFITGDRDGDLVLFALDLEGRPRWQAKNGAAWTGDYPGARATCAYHEGRLFHLNAHGRAAAFDAQTGRELWAVDILDRFRAGNLTWAMSECLLVDQDRVLVTPGGDKAFMAALDAKTGQTVWSGDPLPEAEKQRAGYASPILLRCGGRRMIVTLALRAMVGVDAESGKVLWSYPKRTAFDASAATPAWTGSGFFYTLPLRSGAVLVRLDGSLRPDRIWEHALDNCQGGVVAKDGMIY